MGFLNIMGGVAAGAQRADELEAKLAASKTKTANPLKATVAEIIKNRYLESKEATNANISAGALIALADAGEEGPLNAILAKSVKYKSKLDNFAKQTENKTNVEKGGGFMVIDPETNDSLIFNSIPDTLKARNINYQTGDRLDQPTALSLYNIRTEQLHNLVDFYGGYTKIPTKELVRFGQIAFGGLNDATDLKDAREARIQIALSDRKNIAKSLLGNKAFDANDQHIDVDKSNAFGDALSVYPIFGNTKGLEVAQGTAAEKLANDPKSTLVPAETSYENIPNNALPIIHANRKENLNNDDAKDYRDEKSSIERFGVKTIRDTAMQVIQTDGTSPLATNNFARAAVLMTKEAEDSTQKINPFAILGAMYRATSMPKSTTTQRRTRNGGIATITVPAPTTPKKILDREAEITKKLEKSSSTINNTLERVDSLQMIMFDMGILRAVEAAKDTNNKNDILNRLGLSAELTQELQSMGRISPDGTVSKASIRDAFNALRIRVNGLTPQQINMLEAEGAAALAKLPAGVSNLYETIKANILGAVNIVSSDAAEGLTQTFEELENSGEIIQNADMSLAARGGPSFNSLIDQEKESLKKSQAIMESEQNAERQFSKQYLLAQAAAQISFEKIQLAYTYAAIAQGGEGSARTISDTDFANSILSLFRAQGRELAAVMRGIELQLVDERDRIQQIISFSGTGKMSDFTRIAQRAGRDIRKVRKVAFGIGRGFGSGAIEPPSSATDPKVSDAPAEPEDQESLQLGAEQTLRELTGVPGKKQGETITTTIRDNADKTDVDVSYGIGVTGNSLGRYNSSINRFQSKVAPLLLQMLNERGYEIRKAEDLNSNPRVYSALTDFILDSDDIMKSFAFLEVKNPEGLKFDGGIVNMYDILKYAAGSLRQRPERNYTLTDASVMEVTKRLTKGVLTHIYRNYDKVKSRM